MVLGAKIDVGCVLALLTSNVANGLYKASNLVRFSFLTCGDYLDRLTAEKRCLEGISIDKPVRDLHFVVIRI